MPRPYGESVAGSPAETGIWGVLAYAVRTYQLQLAGVRVPGFLPSSWASWRRSPLRRRTSAQDAHTAALRSGGRRASPTGSAHALVPGEAVGVDEAPAIEIQVAVA